MTRRPDLQVDARRGAAFVQAVRQSASRPCVYSLGGSGILVRSLDTTVVIDPYLTNTLGDAAPDAPPGWRDRNAPPPVSAQDLTGLTALLITHDHGDHFDPATVQALSSVNPGLTVVLPLALRSAALDLGLQPEQLRHPATLLPLQVGDVIVQAIPAAHVPAESPQVQPDEQGGTRQVGYLLRLGACTLYHAGDTVVYPDLPDLLEGVDVAVLPVNGRRWSPLQPARLGNLTGEEAADLAGVSGVQVVIPVHHTLLGSSAGGLDAFLRRAAHQWPQLEVALLEPGDCWCAPV